MATNQPLSDREPPRPAGETASNQIAAAFRRARLTLLCGDNAAHTSAVLIDGVLPQLRRRSADAVVSLTKRPLESTRPVPDRRSAGGAEMTELAIFVNDWGTASQASLHDGIDAALRATGVDPEWYREPLTERVQSLSSRFNTRFMFVLDGFDAVLESLEHQEARAELLGELVQLLNTHVPANVLIAMPASAEPLLSPLLERLHAVRAEVLMLEGGRTRRVYGPAAAATPAAPAAPSLSAARAAAKATSKPEPTQLSQFDSARMPEAANTGAPTRPAPFDSFWREHERAARPATEASLAPMVAPVRRLTRGKLAAIASVAIVAIVGGGALFRTSTPGDGNPSTETLASADTPAAPLPSARATKPVQAATSTTATERAPLPAPPPATTPTPVIQTLPPLAVAVAPAPTLPLAPLREAAVPTPVAISSRPSFALRVDADNATTRLPRELAQALAAEGNADLQIVPSSLALPATTGRGAAPGLAIVRYDALQGGARAAAKSDLAVVAPLYREEVQIVVRADSPLRFIHEIDGRRINVGASQGARAVTGRTLYRQMFDRPLPSTPQAQLEAAPALQQLLANGALDAVLLVGPQPAAALAALPPVQRKGLKLLALAPANAASRRALQTYLPATLRDTAGGTIPSLAAMSFLVTTGTPNADAARTLGRITTSLCRNLPELQRDGDAKWRELRAGLELDTGWPQAGAAEAAWRACAGGSVVSSASPSAATSGITSVRN